ncbi:MAG TPA: hypothetical protein VF070_05330 [Streptosporangiaceae bacterium]
MIRSRIVLGQREDEVSSDLLDLSADAKDLFVVQVQVLFGEAEQFTFPHSQQCRQLGDSPQLVGVRVDEFRNGLAFPDRDIGGLLYRNLDDGRLGGILADRLVGNGEFKAAPGAAKPSGYPGPVIRGIRSGITGQFGQQILVPDHNGPRFEVVRVCGLAKSPITRSDGMKKPEPSCRVVTTKSASGNWGSNSDAFASCVPGCTEARHHVGAYTCSFPPLSRMRLFPSA